MGGGKGRCGQTFGWCGEMRGVEEVSGECGGCEEVLGEECGGCRKALVINLELYQLTAWRVRVEGGVR